MWRWVTASLLLTASLVGCEAQEYALLLQVTVSDVYVQELEVEARSLSADRSIRVERRIIERDAIDIAAAPMRVAVTFPGPTTAAVRIVSSEVGDRPTHSIFRCYDVSGVVHDELALLPLSTADEDGDGWPGDLAAGCGESCPTPACPAEMLDCDDIDLSVNPGANELCGEDANCDGETLECQDEDGDGWPACPPGTVTGGCDCDDVDPEIHPDEEGMMSREPCGSPVDINCDGYFGDLCDRDGDGVYANVEVGGFPDCDDTDPNVNPDAEESCETPGDENCDGAVDEGCFPDDFDSDGVLVGGGDCDNCDPASYPGAVERCGDGVDQDCDGMDLACAADDADGDGFRASEPQECDDTDPAMNAAAPEQCDTGEDEDCDGNVDEDCPDPDGDGYVETGTVFEACEGDAMRGPGQVETCDGSDEDCDGFVDEDAAADGFLCVRPAGGSPTEVDTTSSLEHCGGCGIRCHPRRADSCVDGRCICSTDSREEICDPGLVCCDGGGSASGCRDFSSDFDNCGDCGNACDPDRADGCSEGRCSCGGGPECTGALICCRGRCVNFDRDPNNCGACGDRCGEGEQCNGGLCHCYDDTYATEPNQNACKSNETCCARDMRCRKPNSC
jgi:hypothetical protein